MNRGDEWRRWLALARWLLVVEMGARLEEGAHPVRDGAGPGAELGAAAVGIEGCPEAGQQCQRQQPHQPAARLAGLGWAVAWAGRRGGKLLILFFFFFN